MVFVQRCGLRICHTGNDRTQFVQSTKIVANHSNISEARSDKLIDNDMEDDDEKRCDLQSSSASSSASAAAYQETDCSWRCTTTPVAR